MNPLATAVGTAGAAVPGVDLVAVVLVVGDPVDVVQGAVVALQGIVIIVPEAL